MPSFSGRGVPCCASLVEHCPNVGAVQRSFAVQPPEAEHVVQRRGPRGDTMLSWKHLAAISALLFPVLISDPGAAQGVFVPTPGSAPAAVGPNSTNPSAAASDTPNPSAMNPSAAPSAVTTPNALNPSGTSSTFAPTPSNPNVLTRPIGSPSRIIRRPTRRAPAVNRSRARRAPAQQTAPRTPSRKATEQRGDQRARSIVGSVCRGC